jgi:hypothetical protein
VIGGPLETTIAKSCGVAVADVRLGRNPGDVDGSASYICAVQRTDRAATQLPHRAFMVGSRGDRDEAWNRGLR